MSDELPFSYRRSPKKTFLANYRKEAEECYLSPENPVWDFEDDNCGQHSYTGSFRDWYPQHPERLPAYTFPAHQPSQHGFKPPASCSYVQQVPVGHSQGYLGSVDGGYHLEDQFETKPDIHQLALEGIRCPSSPLGSSPSAGSYGLCRPLQNACGGFLAPGKSSLHSRNLEVQSSGSSPSGSPHPSVSSCKSPPICISSPDAGASLEKSEFEAKYMPTSIIPRIPNVLFRRVWADRNSASTKPLPAESHSREGSCEVKFEPQELTEDNMSSAMERSRRQVPSSRLSPGRAVMDLSDLQPVPLGLSNPTPPEESSNSGEMERRTQRTSSGEECSRDRVISVDSVTSTILMGRSGGDKNTLCQVCGDQAAGFYCGAYICEACKKFFIRASKQDKVKYTCLRDKNCTITKENRVQCQYCRYQKCLSFNMYCPKNGKRTLSDAGIGDIPCRVCGSPSSGFHFGTLTCEGCKGFFRRMAKEREPESYQCSKNGQCQINSMTRNICKACRYQKCLSVGMSLKASRIGRQPNSVKHAISLEVKRQQPEKQPPLEKQPPAPQQKKEEEAPPEIEMAFGMNYIPVTVASSPRSLAYPTFYPISPLTKTLHFTKQEVPDPDFPEKAVGSLSQQGTAGSADPQLSGSPDSSLDPIKSLSKETIYNSLKNGMVDLRNIVETCPINDSFNEERFSTLTGLWEEMMERFHRHASNVIKFAKKVAGFRTIHIEDQVILVQIASYPIVILNFSRQFDLVSGYYNYFGFSKQEEGAIMRLFPMFDVLQEHFKHAGFMLKTLAMDEMEIALMSALLLVNDECMTLKDRDRIRSLQEELMDCLKDYEEKTYERGQERFGTLLLRIAEFALVSVQHGQVVSTLTQTYPQLLLPQLYQDMYIK